MIVPRIVFLREQALDVCEVLGAPEDQLGEQNVFSGHDENRALAEWHTRAPFQGRFCMLRHRQEDIDAQTVDANAEISALGGSHDAGVFELTA